MTAQKHPIIYFDGICILCNKAVRFVIKHDPQGYYKFMPLQSTTGQKLLATLQQKPGTINSFFLDEGDKIYSKSTAALRVARNLSGPVKWLYGFIIVPSFIRDWIYEFISKNRFRWFGKRDRCMVPGKDISQRFLND
ncbi:MAG: thiol-disulfide oxidoreductase DCC family protein [Niastella sp.]|nr:thiol-disulfide oxidoreductase DCC family protein [Niastella sp.]